MSKKRRKISGPPLSYKVDPEDERQLILKNGTRIRHCRDDVCAYCSQGGRFYTLTRYGLRVIKVQLSPKKNYGKRIMTGRGHHQGQHYPHVSVGGKHYSVHHMMMLAWCGAWDKLIEVVDHIDGNIYNWRLDNLRKFDKEENDRCGGILRRLRNIAKERNDPSLLPIYIDNADLLEIFERTKCMLTTKNRSIRKAMFLREVERYRTLIALRKAAVDLNDPSLNPDNMDAERREMILSRYCVEDPAQSMDDDF